MLWVKLACSTLRRRRRGTWLLPEDGSTEHTVQAVVLPESALCQRRINSVHAAALLCAGGEADRFLGRAEQGLRFVDALLLLLLRHAVVHQPGARLRVHHAV